MDKRNSPAVAEKPSKGGKKQSKCRFLDQLFDLLENDEYPEIITWSEDGSKFIIKDVEALTNEVLPVLFTHKNFSSFVRQLHMYYFKKCKVSGYHYSYANPNFQKNRADLLECISRRKIAKNQDTPISNEASQSSRLIQLEWENAELKHREKRLKQDLTNCQEIIWQLYEDNRALKEKAEQRMNYPPAYQQIRDHFTQPQSLITPEHMMGYNQENDANDNSFSYCMGDNYY